MPFNESIEQILETVLPVVPSPLADEPVDEEDGDNYISRTGGKRPSLTHYDNKRSNMVDRYSWGDYAEFGIYD